MWSFPQRDLIRDVVIILVVLLCNGETWDRRPLRFYPMSIIKQSHHTVENIHWALLTASY